MFFIRWEEGLCVMFLNRDVIGRHQVPNEAEFF